MNTEILTAEQNNIRFIRLQGKVTHDTGMGLSHFVEMQLSSADLKEVVLDLSQTEYLDSTILGVLARLAVQTREKLGFRPNLITGCDDVNTLLQNIGFESLFHMVTPDGEEINSIEFAQIPSVELDERQRGKMILEAHKQLCDLNDGNKRVFSKIVDMMEKDVARKSSV